MNSYHSIIFKKLKSGQRLEQTLPAKTSSIRTKKDAQHHHANSDHEISCAIRMGKIKMTTPTSLW